MQIVINIPDIEYRLLRRFGDIGANKTQDFAMAIINGIPLPKGHGRLIDADRLKEEMEKDVRRAMSFVDLTDFVWLAPTIIEADEEGNHE